MAARFLKRFRPASRRCPARCWVSWKPPCLRQAYDQKNIRRRVYDALNVLMAMNIISKEKKEIKWIGLPTNSAQECQNLEVLQPRVPWRVRGRRGRCGPGVG